MPKGTQSASDLARNIRTKKLEAVKERDKLLQEDELEALRTEVRALRSYTAQLEDLLRTTEASLMRMSARDGFNPALSPSGKVAEKAIAKTITKKPPMPPKTNGGTLFDPMAVDEP